jgi:hypothetical protein
LRPIKELPGKADIQPQVMRQPSRLAFSVRNISTPISVDAAKFEPANLRNVSRCAGKTTERNYIG